MNVTLTRTLESAAVPFQTLHARYRPLLELVRKLIGVVPNCDPYLEIWPAGFRSYNVMVPNFLNLPFSLWGAGAPIDVVGLAMYASSRTAACAYCSAHTCSFALRRGAAPDKLAAALDGKPELFTEAERAAIAVARSLSRVPSTVEDAERQALARHFSPAQIEWIVLSVAMMGFLNKFMDAVGVELEVSTVGEVKDVIGASGWAPGKHLSPEQIPAGTPPPRADGFFSKLSVIRYVPAALMLDRAWTAEAPKRWPAAGAWLRERTGHDFPLLSRLRHARAIRAIAVMARDNLDAETTRLGLDTKCLAGLVYATVVGNAELADELRRLAAHHGAPTGRLDEVARFAAGDTDEPGGDERARAALRLARELSPSPARSVAPLLAEAGTLEPAALIELVVFLSVAQLIHRLERFYPAR